MKYAGQSLGLVVAKTQMEAMRAAQLVQVKYKNFKTPVLTIREALKDPARIRGTSISNPTTHFSVGNLDGNIHM